MDTLLRRAGFLPVWLLSFVCAVAAAVAGDRRGLGDAAVAGDRRGLGDAALRLAAAVLFVLAFRAAALRGDAERRGLPPPAAAARLRRLTTASGAVLGLVLGAVAARTAEREYGRGWLTTTAAVVVAVATLYATRPLPRRDAPRAPGPATPDVDGWIARIGILPFYVAAAVCLNVDSSGPPDVAHAVVQVAGTVLLGLAVRGIALSYASSPRRWPPRLVTALRVVLAAAAGTLAWLAGEPGWHAALLAVTAAASVAYVARPFPAWLTTDA